MLRRLRILSILFGSIVPCSIAAISLAQEAKPSQATPPVSKTAFEIDVSERLSADQARKDISQFRKLIDEQWPLAKASGENFDAAIDALQSRAVDGITKENLILELQKVIALGIDGHAEMSAFHGLWNGQAIRSGKKSHETGQLPFLIDLCGDKYVAYVRDKSPGEFVNAKLKYRYRLLDDQFPFVEAIDGVPIDAWVKCARQFVPKGPERAVRWGCVQILNGLRFMRGQLGLEVRDDVNVTLGSEDHSRTTMKTLRTSKLYQLHLRKPRPAWKLLDDEIGYISMHNCAETGTEALIAGMSHFRQTKGLIIDCRDNQGHGPPEAAIFLGAFLMPDDAPRMIVGSLVKRKLLNSTGCVYLGMPGLSADEETAIRSFSTQYRPELLLPADKFDTHYVMLTNPRRSEAKWGMFAQPEVRKMFNEAVYHYERPVVILTSHRTFSSGEMFAACLEQLPNVTIVGTPTRASVTGPGRHTLGESGISVLLGASVFQQGNGKLVDGRGISPDVLVEIDADYYRDTRDTTLEAGIKVLKGGN